MDFERSNDNELIAEGFDRRVAMAIGFEGTSTKKLRNSANNIVSPIRKIPQLILKDKIVNNTKST